MKNPLILAVKRSDELLEAENAVIVAAVGEQALKDDKLFEQIYGDVQDLILFASCAVSGLSARERTEQLDLFWKDFLAEHATASANLDRLPAELVQ